jgi:hypothetical protein
MITTRFVEDSDGSLIVHREADVEPILEANKALAASGDGYSPSRELRRAATVPFAVLEKWKNELGIDYADKNDWPKIMALLDSNEYRHFRTAPGVLSRKPRRRFRP